MSALAAVAFQSRSLTTRRRQQIAWACTLAFAAVCIFGRQAAPWLVQYPKSWIPPVAPAVSFLFDGVVSVLAPISMVVSAVLGAALGGCGSALRWMPWPSTLLFLVMLGWLTQNRRTACFTFLGLAYVVLAGYWQQAMNTMSMVVLALPFSVGFGFLTGVAAHYCRSIRRPTLFALDLLQTVPAFAFLVPLLLLFGFGPVAGMVACIAYAVPPMVHCTMLGLARVPVSPVEVGDMAGCTPWQSFRHVMLPAAQPQILIGVNQTIMACFSMVIMASIIGGFDDIGWAVLDAMRKADFGGSLLSGLVIAALAMVIDRLTRGLLLPRRGDAHNRNSNLIRTSILLAAPIVAGILLHLSPATLVWFDAIQGLIRPDFLNDVLIGMVREYAAPLGDFKNFVLYHFMLPLRIGLANAVAPLTWGGAWTPVTSALYLGAAALVTAWLLVKGRWKAGVATILAASFLLVGFNGFPWPAFIALVATLAWSVSGVRLAAGCVAATSFVIASGLYEPLGQSLYLCLLAVLLCTSVGGTLGILAAKNDRFSAFVRPVCDTLQTMPQFIFLIPALMVFQVGELTGLIAIALYAIVPPIRYFEQGLRGVPADLVETSRQVGCTDWQRLIYVELPASRPEVVLGINQTIMASLSMLPVAALVGTKDLGQQVYVALSKADVGEGLVAGLSIAAVAVVADRIMRASISRRQPLRL